MAKLDSVALYGTDKVAGRPLGNLSWHFSNSRRHSAPGTHEAWPNQLIRLDPYNQLYSPYQGESPRFRILPYRRDVGVGIVQLLPSRSRRLNSRVETGRSVWAYWECNGDPDLSRVMDISMGGLFIETHKPKRVGSTTSVHFLVEEGEIRADAVVRHVNPGHGLGLKFNAVSDKDRRNLEALMERLRSLAKLSPDS